MKVITLEISRKQHATITVTVPDDSDEARLRQSIYADAITEAADELDVDWRDEPGGEVEVENWDRLGGEAAAKELAEYGHVDLAPLLAAADVREKEQRAKWEAHWAAKAKEAGK